MTEHCNATGSDRRLKAAHVTTRLVGLLLAFLVIGAASAQDAEPPAEPQQLPLFQPDFLDTLGRWLGDSKAKLDGQIKSTTDAAKEAANAVGQATGVIFGAPGARIVDGRKRCAVAANGAADCAAAANALCHAKGFTTGRGLDINTAQKCPTWVWLSGRPPPEGVCTTETFVLRAVCQ